MDGGGVGAALGAHHRGRLAGVRWRPYGEHSRRRPAPRSASQRGLAGCPAKPNRRTPVARRPISQRATQRPSGPRSCWAPTSPFTASGTLRGAVGLVRAAGLIMGIRPGPTRSPRAVADEHAQRGRAAPGYDSEADHRDQGGHELRKNREAARPSYEHIAVAVGVGEGHQCAVKPQIASCGERRDPCVRQPREIALPGPARV